MKKFDLAVVGGGAAGSIAAITAAKNGQKVIILEKNSVLGRKILATGNGRCNLTNTNANASRYHGAKSDFIENVLAQFDQHQTIKFFEDLGIILKEEDRGRIFPYNNQASTVTEALLQELNRLKVNLKLETAVRRIGINGSFKIDLSSGEEILADKLILACGGAAAPQLGTTGDAYFWLKNLGHTIIEPRPALVPVETRETWPQEVQGLKIAALVTLKEKDRVISAKQEELIFTHFGVSGPAIMWQTGFIKSFKNPVTIHIDLFPSIDNKNLDTKIAQIITASGAKTIKNCLIGILPHNLIPVVLKLVNINPDQKAAEVSKNARLEIVGKIKDLTLTIKSLRSFKEAQVTAGGVDTNEINEKTLESKIIPGLFFAGEIMDVDGDSGGFNLQWAWSSGQLAGISSAK